MGLRATARDLTRISPFPGFSIWLSGQRICYRGCRERGLSAEPFCFGEEREVKVMGRQRGCRMHLEAPERESL